MKKFTLIAALLVSSVATFAQSWKVDKAHAKVGFTVTHMMLSEVDGNFKSFDATITSSKEDFSDAVIELSADINTVDTDNDMRDGHLKGEDFFNTAKFPMLTFKSKSIAKVSGNKYKVTGDLTMRGVTKAVTLDMAITGPVINQKSQKKMIGVKVSGTINRSDFSVGKAPAAVVSEEVEIKANGEFVHQ